MIKIAFGRSIDVSGPTFFTIKCDLWLSLTIDIKINFKKGGVWVRVGGASAAAISQTRITTKNNYHSHQNRQILTEWISFKS
ncbi:MULTISPECIES: hypothetical protein [unclassified Okeania]|uniref:hypothetical protein n=1 Tax=unclassified Okeania TaxID=2634635 RepID=UPI0013BD6602|nr:MULTISPECIES: hypothetical protein [unclassified Okeania]NEP38336.1 hypothetical protein [Okeania sp. SIO2H7]NET12394.1 hypothetical protein [Okeania sp. SIO1H6]NES79690.1 hypothetical protein [Okeania sp. SIO1H4]NET23369.1 hypothetical protein [Okeania sp. SIO1H5]NET97068.1 hypothetical protein [Okeania sp. SIO1H2]